MVVDDHAVVRQGLRQILSDTTDMEMVAEAANGDEAIEKARTTELDVILLDVSMPERNGIDCLKVLRKEKPKLPVLILSMYPEDQYAIRALKAGAAGYLTKQSAPDQLVYAIRQVSSGKKFVSESLAEQLVSTLGEDMSRPLHEKLSDREFQTLQLIASGKTLTQIGEELGLSVKTISVYRARLLEKMRLRNNAELTHYGLKHGLVD
jgi:two-component system, NarL family, invasion response regulator UvrY